jgi:hypothetical protein
VREHIIAAVVGPDEREMRVASEKFDCSCLHGSIVNRRQRSRRPGR